LEIFHPSHSDQFVHRAKEVAVITENHGSGSRPQKMAYTSKNPSQDLFLANWQTTAHTHTAELCYTPQQAGCTHPVLG